MANMSYCRFENTARDLDDCVDAIESGKAEELNEYELRGLVNIFNLAETIVKLKDDIQYALETSRDYDKESHKI